MKVKVYPLVEAMVPSASVNVTFDISDLNKYTIVASFTNVVSVSASYAGVTVTDLDSSTSRITNGSTHSQNVMIKKTVLYK